MSEEEPACEAYFIDNHQSTCAGRFIVSIIFKESPTVLEDSRSGVLKHFHSLEKKLETQLREEYDMFMNEYELLGYMSKVEMNDELEYYLPHHGLVNDTSSTTRLRIVLDSSHQSSSGYSLNF